MTEEKVKIELEFTVNTSPHSLFFRISESTGLQAWFADKVKSENDIFTFLWADSVLKAKVVKFEENVLIRFKPTEDNEQGCYFEFKIRTSELSEETALIITDFVLPDEKEESIDIWEHQVSKLCEIMGVHGYS